MPDELLDRMTAVVGGLNSTHPAGRIAGASGGLVQAAGLAKTAKLGDRALIYNGNETVLAEVIRIGGDIVHLLPEGSVDGIRLGHLVTIAQRQPFAPHDSWIGRVIDPDGRPMDGRPLLPGKIPRPIRAAPPPPHDRRQLGPRTRTGFAVFDTLLPLVRGQRIGLFAGSGVGKSTLLAGLARGVDADVIVIGLVGERGRELRHFIEEVLGPTGMARSVVVAATSDRAPQVRRRCAWTATAVAEHFRDTGRQVLLLVDSVTRFAEAHRELSVSAGEPAALRGFPASTGPAIAALCERAGPGTDKQGDITAIYSVLVSGSDMEEPVADMLRGVLDGHVVLDREIAEGGRFPAVDLLRSVSRALPAAATVPENQMIAETRALLATHDKAAMMIRAGLYTTGTDPDVDAAIACHPGLERFLALREMTDCSASFAALKAALAPARLAARGQAGR